MTGTPSTPESDAELTRLWLLTDPAGKPLHSCAAIGKMLGRTANAVHGRVTRLRLPLRQSPIIPKGTKQTKSWAPPSSVRRAHTLPQLPSAQAAAPSRRAPRLTIVAMPPPPSPVLCFGPGCTFILNDARPWRYCDAPSLSGKSFCPEHHARCFVKPARPHAPRGVDHG